VTTLPEEGISFEKDKLKIIKETLVDFQKMGVWCGYHLYEEI